MALRTLGGTALVAIIVAFFLAIVPYLILRGLVNRLARNKLRRSAGFK